MRIGRHVGSRGFWLLAAGVAVLLAGCTGGGGGQSASPGAGTPSASGAASSAGTIGYFRYENKRFKFSFEVPDGYKATTPPVDGDGQEFEGFDGAASVTGSGVNNIGSSPGTPLATPAQVLAALVSHYQSVGDTVTYKSVDGDIVAVSGSTPQAKIFYQRDVVYSQAVYGFVWSYPASQKSLFTTVINYTVATFTPGPNHGA